MSDANNTQVGGTHYAGAYQHWDLVVAAGLNYFEGQITKYVLRHRFKNGLQDLQKAAHFLQKYREVRSKVPRTERPAWDARETAWEKFYASYAGSARALTLAETSIVYPLCCAAERSDLLLALVGERLRGLIAEAQGLAAPDGSEPDEAYVNQG